MVIIDELSWFQRKNSSSKVSDMTQIKVATHVDVNINHAVPVDYSVQNFKRFTAGNIISHTIQIPFKCYTLLLTKFLAVTATRTRNFDVYFLARNFVINTTFTSSKIGYTLLLCFR